MLNTKTLSEVEAARKARRARKQAKRNGTVKPGAFTVPDEMKRDHHAIADQFALGYRLRADGKRAESEAAFEKARAMQEARRDKWYWVE